MPLPSTSQAANQEDQGSGQEEAPSGRATPEPEHRPPPLEPTVQVIAPSPNEGPAESPAKDPVEPNQAPSTREAPSQPRGLWVLKKAAGRQLLITLKKEYDEEEQMPPTPVAEQPPALEATSSTGPHLPEPTPEPQGEKQTEAQVQEATSSTQDVTPPLSEEE